MNTKGNWLIAVTAGRWQRHGICEARAAGLKVLAIDADANAEGFADADRVLHIDLADHEAVIRAIRAMGLSICGAVSIVSEVGMPLTARLREEFDLPGPRAELCRRLIDKAVQRRIWTEKGVPGPRWMTFSEPASALKGAAGLGFPFIVKPTDSSGSRGVTKIESAEDNIQDAISHAFRFSRSGDIILESYMDGTEFTVETFAADNEIHVLAVTEKKKVAGTRGTVASELATPDRPPEVVDRIAQTVVAAYRALDYVEGPGHAEVILMKDGSVGMVEAAARGGGFMVFDGLIPVISGVNIARLTALQAAGLPVGPISNWKRAAVLRFFPARPGLLQGFSGFEEANLIEGVEAAPFVKPGDRFHRAAADGDRLGYILSCAATPSEARERADQAERLIRFDIEEFR